MIPEPHARASASTATITPPARQGESGSWPMSDDPRVVAALEEYLVEIQLGRRPAREDFLSRHPDIAGALGVCLDGLDFLRSAARDLSGPNRPTSPRDAFPPSTCLGDYRIIREIGRGGMGVVYEAEQISLGRRVALKVLPFAAAIDPRQRQRFQVEAQAAAHLHHPHIVPIFAVGQEGGSHFYAMPFIEGKTLAATIQELRRFGGLSRGEAFLAARLSPDGADAPDSSSEDLTPTATASPNGNGSAKSAPSGSSTSQKGRGYYRAVARLGIEAAEALDHAHGLGVLHRDIKPANLLIDVHGKLWVADFGLARFRDDPGPTRTGDLLGTLRYMSPEQIEARHGVVDQRADIFALGATLYEALTLRPAFTGRDRQEIIQRILTDEPARPRKIDPAIPRDLETILLKAMAKSPSARYGTAQEFADDLRRFLDDQAILACPPTPMDRAVRWVRKRRTMVATAATVLVVATVVGSMLLVAEQKKTSDALASTKLALDEAEANLSNTNRALDLAILSTSNLTMRAMETVTAYGQEKTSKPQDLEFFRLAMEFYQGVEQTLRNDPAPRRREMLAKAYFGLGLTKWLLKQPGSEESYRNSIAEYESLIEQQPMRTDLHWHLAASLEYLGKKHASTPDPIEAEATYRRLVEVERKMLARDPENMKQRKLLAGGLSTWGGYLSMCDDTSEAEQAYTEALRLNPEHSWASNNLAWLLVQDPDRPPYDPARALPLARKAVAAQPKNSYFLNTLGMALYRSRDWAGAAEALDRSIRLGKVGLPHDVFLLAMVSAKRGDLELARTEYENGLAAMKGIAHPEADLCAIRDEAAEVLGIRERPKIRPKPKSRRVKAIAPAISTSTPDSVPDAPNPVVAPANPLVGSPATRVRTQLNQL